MDDVACIHRCRLCIFFQVYYTKPMPDIERLMQVWPVEFEELLRTVRVFAEQSIACPAQLRR